MIGGIIIGDEIMRGKREDKHFRKLIELLAARGLKLDWAQYLGDSPALITETLRRSLATPDIVFCFGGIGATPDDHTRQAAAEALGLELALHPEAAELIRQRAADMAREGKAPADPAAPENRQRLKMGEFPVGARIIPNPYNRIPGFAIRKHYFVPGFPVMAWPMIEALLDGELATERPQAERVEASFLVYELAESTITPLMEAVERELPGVRTFSLPSVGEDGSRRHIELGAKGSAAQVTEALARLRQGALALGGQFTA